MGDKYRFSISKRRQASLWTKMMSKQRVQFRAADLLTMSPSKGPKMPLHTLMGLQVHLAFVLAHFAPRLLLSRNSAFSSQNSIRENISLHFLLRKIFPGSATYVDPRCQAASVLDVTTWQGFHSWMCVDVTKWQGFHSWMCMDVTTWQGFHSWMSPHGKVHGCHHMAKFPSPLYSTTSRRCLQCQGPNCIEQSEFLTR